MAQNGFVENQRGEKLGLEALGNRFASIGIVAFNAAGKKIEILGEGTA